MNDTKGSNRIYKPNMKHMLFNKLQTTINSTKLMEKVWDENFYINLHGDRYIYLCVWFSSVCFQ
jgi:hypothetical protein